MEIQKSHISNPKSLNLKPMPQINKPSNQQINNYLKERYSAATTEAYYREIIIFLKNFPDAQSAGYKQIMDYIGQLRERYHKSGTVRRLLHSIKAYYSFLNYSDNREDNPAASIRLRDRQEKEIQLQDLFTAQELETLLAGKKERYRGLELRNRVLMSLLIYQALLPQEIGRIRLDDIDLEKGTVYVRGAGKTNSRTLPLKTLQVMLFYNYIHKARPKLLGNRESKMFLTGNRGKAIQGEDIPKHIKRHYSKRFEGRKITAQSIRQSVITNLLKSGKELRVVQAFAGHKYPSATEKYRQNSVEALKRAINNYHPIK